MPQLKAPGLGLTGGPAVGTPGSYELKTLPTGFAAVRLEFGTDGSGYHYAIAKNQGGVITELLAVNDDGTVTLIPATGGAQTTALLKVRGAVNTLEFGHPNSAGFASVVGFESGTGKPFVAFSAEHGAGTNSYRTRGLRGSILRGDLAGGFEWLTVPNANADNQAPTLLATLDSGGGFVISGPVRMSSGTLAGVASGVASNLVTVPPHIDAAYDVVVRISNNSNFSAVHCTLFTSGSGIDNPGLVGTTSSGGLSLAVDATGNLSATQTSGAPQNITFSLLRRA